jgi:AraC family transcriptional regulator of adaptative response / DNA-3-methyladenine glycosylase II
MALIAEGTVEREGLAGLARRLGLGQEELDRRLAAELGAGASDLARAERLTIARTLVEATDLEPLAVALAAGFDGRAELVGSLGPASGQRGQLAVGAATIRLRLPYRGPLDGRWLLDFLGARAVPGTEERLDGAFRTGLRLPHGCGLAELRPEPDAVALRLRLVDVRDLRPALARCRRLLDLDADPDAVLAGLGGDALLGPMVRRRPGIRVPGHPDGAELAIRAVLGQQVSVAAARTQAGRLVRGWGEPLPVAEGRVTHLFPAPAAVAEAAASLALPEARRRSLRELALALARGELEVGPGADMAELRRQLLVLPGIGPWTAAYVTMRLGDPDVFLPTDLGVRRGLARLGVPAHPRQAAALAEAWRPWRSYAVVHLWALERRKDG